MPWQNPKTWKTGDLLTAPEMNSQLRDNLRYLKGLPFAQASLRRAANYSSRDSNFVDIDSSELSFTVEVTGAAQIGFLGTFQMDRAGSIHLDLAIDGLRFGQNAGMAQLRFASANQPQHCGFTIIRDHLTPGRRRFHMQWRVFGGNGQLFASASTNDPPAFFWVRALP